MTKIHLNLEGRGYDINIGRGLLSKADQLFNLNRNVLVVTDDGVPKEYAEAVKSVCKEAKIITLPQGESTKSLKSLEEIYNKMLDFDMTRSDCVVAVGGGVIGDLAGFAAASFMRGIDFYNIPTTLLSQVDSSIGGKTAINLGGVKNIVGAFYQPKGVIIDADLLKTLPERHIKNGLAESIKMAITSDKELFEFIENNAISNDILEQIIIRSIKIKKEIVEADECEGGVRRILNLGHTLGHGIEADASGSLYHGECVAIGLIPVCSTEVRARLVPLLKKVGLPTEYEGDLDKALGFIVHDKKKQGETINIVLVDEIGSYKIEKMDVEEFSHLVRKELK